VPSRLDGLLVESLGTLPAEDVSAWLQTARAGFMAYPPAFLGKSTVFAAYAAHGLAPVVAWNRDQDAESARRATHFLTPRELVTDALSRGTGVASQARAWYQDHSLRKQADIYSDLLFGDA
jgi:hypothetical protein